MNPNEYQQLAMRTKADPATILDRLATGSPKWMQAIVAFMGLTDELGEVAGPLKKKIEYNGPDPDITNMKEEIGDMLWRIAQLADAFDLKLEDCMEANIAKLQKRYPERYSDHAALNRNLETERQTLEGIQQSDEGEILWLKGIPTEPGTYEAKASLNLTSVTWTFEDFKPGNPWPSELSFYRKIK